MILLTTIAALAAVIIFYYTFFKPMQDEKNEAKQERKKRDEIDKIYDDAHPSTSDRFYKKIKYTLTPGLENVDFVSNLDVSNFIKESKAFYQSKGTEESFRILFNVLYGVTPKVIDLEQYLLKPSSAQFIRREND